MLVVMGRFRKNDYNSKLKDVMCLEESFESFIRRLGR